MYGYMEGYSDTDDFSYCPFCGAELDEYHADGTSTCRKCGKRFGVLEIDEEEERNDTGRDIADCKADPI